MLSTENNLNYNLQRRNILGGKVTSIWNENSIFVGARSHPILDFTYLTSNFSDFEKNVYEQEQKMNYHLSGYGTSFNEALVSYIGESSERYTFASFYNIIKDYIITRSYNEMCVAFGEDNVCPLELINSYFDSSTPENYVVADDSLQWIPMNSLINPGEKVYIPLQFVVSNNGQIYSKEKPFMTSAVSTGTACYENVKGALENAIIEYLQIDSFNMWWYSGYKGEEISIDVVEFLKQYFTSDNSIKNFCENFQITFSDISFDKNIDIVVCEIFAKNDFLPQYTVGVQGGIGKEKTLYRSFMEAIAVLEYNMNLPWMDGSKYRNITKGTTKINNLDDNVILYSKYGKSNKVEHKTVYTATHKKKDYNLVKTVQKLSKFAGYLVITAPEFDNLNLEVVRICIPELLPLCLPSYPPYFHNRYKTIGGIKNNVPHPLA